jgi:uncharacterized protein DUF4240
VVEALSAGCQSRPIWDTERSGAWPPCSVGRYPQNVLPCWHDPAVDISTFWDIIETARASAGQDRPFHEALTDHLATLTGRSILEYYERYEKMRGALYRWDLWAAACLIGGGCSDDGFIDFRAGLIARGREWYYRAAASPDNLAGHPAVAGAGHPAVTTRCSTRRSATPRLTRSSGLAVTGMLAIFGRRNPGN